LPNAYFSITLEYKEINAGC